MSDDTITVHDLIKVLNEALQMDRKAVSQVVNSRFTCSIQLANHPTIQVGENDQGLPTLSAVGLFNGVFPTIEFNGHPAWGQITVIRDEDTGQVERFLHTTDVQSYLANKKDEAPL